jgi:peroxiredoxin
MVLVFASALRADERILRFPPERAMGVIYIRDAQPPRDAWSDWTRLAVAQGDVPIPAGKAVRLDPSSEALTDLSPLGELAPDDIDMIQSYGTDAVGPLAPLVHLTGLRVLILRAPLSDEQFRELANIAGLEDLSLSGSPVTDQQLEQLVALPRLRRINLSGTKITDAGLKSLAKMPPLEQIDLSATDVGDAGMAHLVALPQLRRLSVMQTDVGDDGLRALAQIASLESLGLQYTPATDAGLAHLAGLKLKELFLMPRGSGMSDAGMVHVGKITTLERVWLVCTLTDACIPHLANLKSLKDLQVYGPLTDAAVAELAKLPSLEKVWFEGDTITDEGLAQLAALPRLRELHGPIGPVTLRRLAENPANIESLNLDGKRIVSADLKTLAGFPALRRLYLNNMDLRGAAIDSVTASESVEFIQMRGVSLDDGSLERLGRMPALARLFTDTGEAMAITDAGVEALAQCKSLTMLYLSGKALTDRSLAALAKLPNMETLQILGEFTDEGLAHLEGMPSLHFLNISGNNLSPLALDRLRQTTPSLQTVQASSTTKRKEVVLKAGDAAPEFSVTTFDGKTMSLADLKGKVVMLHFWAMWCTPCVAATPYVKAMHDKLAADPRFVMISISMDDAEHAPRRHAERHKLTWPQAVDGPPRTVADAYGVKGAPTMVVIDADGRILVGHGHYDDARAAVESALAR